MTAERTLREWLLEREQNCLNIVSSCTSDADKDGWLEDASYFRAAIEALHRAPVETKAYSDGTTATGPAPLPLVSPSQQALLADLDAVEAMLGGRNGPTIRIRAAIAKAPPRLTDDQIESVVQNDG